MALSISTNLAAMHAQRFIGKNSQVADKSSAHLASGSSITSASDNAAGLSISEGMRSKMRGLGQAKRNANDGISVLQVAEGGLAEVSNILTRINELGVQAASDTLTDEARSMINVEAQALKNEVQRVSNTTRYGNVDLLSGNDTQFDFQVDVLDSADGVIGFNTKAISANISDIGIDGLDFSNKDNARKALGLLESSKSKVSGFRAELGAMQNRLTSSSDNLGTAIENVASSNSQIRDVDVAASTADKARSEIMLNASTSMLTQANQNAGLALKLI